VNSKLPAPMNVILVMNYLLVNISYVRGTLAFFTNVVSVTSFDCRRKLFSNIYTPLVK